MEIVNANGTILGSVRLTTDDIAGLSRGFMDQMDARVDALRATARANMARGIGSSGPVTPGPSDDEPSGTVGPRPAAPRPPRDDDEPPRGERRMTWWKWLIVALVGFGIIGIITDEKEPSPVTPVTVTDTARVPLASVGSPRAQVLRNGDIVIGSTAVDNVLRSGSPLRNRFTAILAEQGASGLTGKSLDANVVQAITFCQRLADGDAAAARQSQVATRTIPGSGAEMGAQQRAIILGALSAVCPAL